MTERDLGNNNSGHWYGEVVNVKDPDQSGRVQVRIYGRHDDKQNIPDDDLPWVMPIQPVTSAALGKVGTSPLGLLKGSKVQGHWSDSDHQVPIITGSFGKAGEYKSGSNTDGVPEIDIDKGSMPTASTNQSPPVDINPYSKLFEGRITINDINNGVKTIGAITRATGVVNKKAVDSKLKEPSKPTIASADKGNKGDVLSIIKKVDPNNLSASLPMMVGSFSEVKNIMNLTSPLGITNLLSTGIQGAIGSLAGQFGFGNVMGAMTGLLGSGLLSGQAQKALKMAVLAGIDAGGAHNIPNVISSVIPQINPNKIPLATLISTSSSLPKTYTQNYYPLDQEPHPGYIEWINPDNKTQKLYTLRGDEPHYSSPEEHVAGNSAAKLQNTMSSTMNSIAGNAIGAALSNTQLSSLANSITGGLSSVAADGLSKVLGGGATLANMSSLASKLIPGIAGKIDGVLKGQLPKSVLDPGKIGKTMNEFTKNQALLAKKKSSMKAALEPDTAAEDKKFKDYADSKLATDLSKAAPGTTVSISVPLADGTTYTKTATK